MMSLEIVANRQPYLIELRRLQRCPGGQELCECCEQADKEWNQPHPGLEWSESIFFPLEAENSNREAAFVLSPSLRGQALDEIEHFSVYLHLTQVQHIEIDMWLNTKRWCISLRQMLHVQQTLLSCNFC